MAIPFAGCCTEHHFISGSRKKKTNGRNLLYLFWSFIMVVNLAMIVKINQTTSRCPESHVLLFREETEMPVSTL